MCWKACCGPDIKPLLHLNYWSSKGSKWFQHQSFSYLPYVRVQVLSKSQFNDLRPAFGWFTRFCGISLSRPGPKGLLRSMYREGSMSIFFLFLKTCKIYYIDFLKCLGYLFRTCFLLNLWVSFPPQLCLSFSLSFLSLCVFLASICFFPLKRLLSPVVFLNVWPFP